MFRSWTTLENKASVMRRSAFGRSTEQYPRKKGRFLSSIVAVFIVFTLVLSGFMAISQNSNAFPVEDSSESQRQKDTVSYPREAITLETFDEQITTRIYDMFNVPLEEWWYWRTSEEIILNNEFPYINVWLGNPSGNNWVYSNARMNVTATNVKSVNTTERPVYVPICSNTTGGNIEIDWYGNYLTYNETVVKYSPYVSSMYDGWYWSWTGTVSMDRTAAKMVLGMTDADFDDFETWKAAHFGAFTATWSNWLANEAGDGGRVDIKYAYDYPWNPLSESYDIDKVNDTVEFHIDHLSWGAETLFGRWFKETFLEYEYWPEDVTFRASIGPERSGFDLDMAVMYSLYAWHEPANDINPSWIFESVHADRIPSPDTGQYISEFNPYADKSYFNYVPGNVKYGELADYDYTPWPWNLTGENHKLIFEWTDSDQVIGFYQNGTGVYSDRIIGSVVPRWIEPLPGEVPENFVIDFENRTMTIQGPIDMWAWSKETTASKPLRDNWSYWGILPRGCPWIQFEVTNDVQHTPIAAISAPLEVGTFAEVLLSSASYDVDGRIVSYLWDLGDGTNASGSEVAHSWSSPGTKIVTLTVTDDDGLSSMESVWISVESNIPPVAVISGSSSGLVGESLTFNASGSNDPDGTIESFEWDFGDGSTAKGMIVTHSFDRRGSFDVTLTVTDDMLAQDQDVLTVAISADASVPLAKMILPNRATVNQTVQLSGEKSISFMGTIVNWTWDLGDGTTDYGEQITKSWDSPGIYIVSLTVRNDNGSVSDPDIALIEICSTEVGGIGLSLSRHSLFPSESADLTITIVDGAGNPITDFSGDVNISCNETVGVTIPSSHYFDGTEGGSVTLADSVMFAYEGSYEISVECGAVRGLEYASVANRTVEMRIYDIFQYPLYDFWNTRHSVYGGTDERYMNAPSQPTVLMYRPNLADYEGVELFTTYRMELEGRNVPNINMDNPTFVPIIPDWTTWIDEIPGATGGNATYDLYMQYMTHDEVVAAASSGLIPPVMVSSDDGWFARVDANLSMDRDAAARLIGIDPSWNQATIENWWDIFGDDHGFDVREAWECDWWDAEANTDGRLDIRAAYDGYEMFIITSPGADYTLTVLDGGNTINISMTRVTWGEDVLLSRQLFWGGEAFDPATPYTPTYPNWSLAGGVLPMECYLEDLHMKVDLGPTDSDIWLDTAVMYGFRAGKSDSAPSGAASWRWEPILQDYIPSLGGMRSELDPWYDSPGIRTYTSWDPGSSAFGQELQYDWVPHIWEMVEGESLIFECPDSSTVGFNAQPLIGEYYENLEYLKKWGYAEFQVTGTDEYTIDAATGELRLAGPFHPDITPHPDEPTIHYWSSPTIELIIGTEISEPPIASFTVYPQAGSLSTLFSLDASSSWDPDGTAGDLLVRWDFEDDGIWDTDWNTTKTVQHQYALIGDYTIRLAVKDVDGLISQTTRNVTVEDMAPTANAGPNRTVDEDAVVSLDGSASYDDIGITYYNWSFFDQVQILLYGVSPNYTFATPGIYVITLYVTDTTGKWDADTVTITVRDLTPPVADAGEDQMVPQTTIVQLNGSGSTDNSGIIALYMWTFDDSGSVTLYGEMPGYDFDNPGIFTVTLTVFDSWNNTGSDTVNITVLDIYPPDADAGTDRTVDEDTNVILNGGGSYDNVGIVNYTWLIEDVAPVTMYGIIVSYVFETPGLYNVSLTVYDAAGYSDMAVIKITVVDVTDPIADAGADQTVDEDTLVTFNGNGSTDNVGIDNYTWSFVDSVAEELYGEIATYTFTEPGEYIVTLTVTDEEGNWDTNTVTIIVLDVTDPVANAGPDQTMDQGELVTLDGSGSYDNVGVVNYTWSLFDSVDVPLYGVSPNYTFDTPGTYVVTLEVLDEAGNSGSNSVTITVLDTTDPVADAGDDFSTYLGQEIVLDGSDSTDNVGIDNYTWSFSDGTPMVLYGVEVSYTFSTSGVFSVMLTVSDAAGNSDTDELTVTVVTDIETPVADAGTDQTVSKESTVTFEGSGSTDNVGIVNYTWSFVDSGESRILYGVNPSYQFVNSGTFDILLTVRDSSGNTDIDTVRVVVDGDGAGTSFFEDNLWWISLLVIIVIVGLGYLLAMRGRKGNPPSENKDSEAPKE